MDKVFTKFLHSDEVLSLAFRTENQFDCFKSFI